MPPLTQLPLRLGAIHNSELFSAHWLKTRLQFEPEWNEFHERAITVLGNLLELWAEQRNRTEHYGSEQSLEQAFIQPILQILGWKLIYQTRLRGRKPDYALFLDDSSLDASLAAGRLSSSFWKYPTLLADAKAWHVPLHRPTITSQQREYPPEQIEWYLNNSLVNYAILTNGRLWRLIPRQYEAGQPRFQTYFECDLAKLLDERANQLDLLPNLWSGFEEFVQFLFFFSPIGFQSTADRIPLVDRARTGSGYYRVGVGDGLKSRVFEALRLAIEGFLNYEPNDLSAEAHLEHCRYNSLVLLYRLLFVLYAEDRKLLPYGVDRAYTENRSLSRFRDLIATRLDRIRDNREPDFGSNEVTLWSDLLSLFHLIDEGAGRYKVPEYDGGLFDEDVHPFLKEKRLADSYLARIIDQLGRAKDLAHGGDDLVPVDYRDLAIQHLGNLYEGLLEWQPFYAHEPVIQVRSTDSEEYPFIPESSRLPKGFVPTGVRYGKGSVYLQKDKRERKSSGSYYTPNNIVDYIVEIAIGPLCEEIDEILRAEISRVEASLKDASEDERAQIESELANLRGQFAERILRLKVLDPAMGSGHFLIRACQYIAEQIATNPHTHDPVAEGLDGDESILTYWKRRVAERCLYGVDKNFMAVELAKLGLWLETIATSLPLTFLDHHLRNGDSLVGATLLELHSLPDAPPIFGKMFNKQLQSTLPTVLATLAQIRSIPSGSAQEVKQKTAWFKKCESLRKPYVTLADLWCSTFYLEGNRRIGLDEYGQLVKLLTKPKAFETIAESGKVGTALGIFRAEVEPFHWHLEFPEVFNVQDEESIVGGFDIVIGNPPYDVLSEKEIGKSLDGFKRFLKHSDVFKPSFVGKNNLYRTFLIFSKAARRAAVGVADSGAVRAANQAWSR